MPKLYLLIIVIASPKRLFSIFSNNLVFERYLNNKNTVTDKINKKQVKLLE